MSKHPAPLLPFVTLALLLTVGACDDEQLITNLALEGTLWTETNFALTNCDDNTDNMNTPTVCTALSCNTLQFNNGTVEAVIVTGPVIETEVGTYTVNGNNIIINFMGIPVLVTFSIAGSVFTMTLQDPVNKGCTRTVTYTGN